MENLDRLILSNPRAESQMLKIENHTNKFIQQHQGSKAAASGVITIPVVVHVVYNTSSQNISDAQIQSQIQVLNEDFRRLNSDKANTPSTFTGIAADVEVEFCLASKDPNGNATTGITRTSTSTTSFSTNDGVKFSSSGGKNAWATDKYLNLWVCKLSGGTLGYAQFPGTGSASTDGVVIGYTCFGKGGTAQSPFNKGRTATHEVGHWLNLRHIWGDGGCSVDDYVNDTPVAGAEHYGCPSWPQVSCSSNDMYMNYMDYVDDACMNLFTNGQKLRMQALFASGGARAGLLTSNGCGGGTTPPPTSTYCASNGQDASYEWISNVNVGTINKTSGTNGGYADFTSTSTDLEIGKNYSISLTPSFGSTAYNEYWKVWIDYNNDKDFDDAGELVFDAGSMSQTTVNGNFTVPSASLGQKRMRVSMKYNGAQTTCESFQYGEVEDYTVNIVSAVQTCNVPTGLSTSNITSSSANVNWSNVSGAVSYSVQYKVSSSSTWINATSASLSGLNSSTTYNWRVKTNCSAGSSAYTATQSFTTIAAACDVPTSLSSASITTTTATVYWSAVSGAASYTFGYKKTGTSTWNSSTVTTNSKSLSGLTSATSYDYRVMTNCASNTSAYASTKTFTTLTEVPTTTTYCVSKGNNSSYEWISKVVVGSINNITGNNGGYKDYTSISTDLMKGSSYPISLTPAFQSSAYNEYWKVWIDYNQDGDFDDAGELVFDAGAMSQTTVSGSIVVPTTVSTGSTRMRVSMKYNAAQTSCESFSYGEVEDYSVNITSATTPPPAPVTYCASKGSDASYEWISNVKIGSINNTSGSNGGYKDFTSISTNLVGGTSYTISLTPSFQSSAYNEYWKIWIDLNNDGDFEDANELVFDAGSMSQTTVTGTMNIPAGYNVTTRMRVSMKYNGAQTSSCETFSYGEVEDYTVTLTGGNARMALDQIEKTPFVNVSIFPNPVNNRLNIELDESYTESTLIRIFDMKGSMVYQSSIEENLLSKSIELNNLINGVYQLILSNGDKQYREKIVISK